MKIEKNIPITRPSKYDFVREMEVGDSVFYEDTAEAKKAYLGMIRVRGGGLKTRKYAIRTQNGGGGRIWRIK